MLTVFVFGAAVLQLSEAVMVVLLLITSLKTVSLLAGLVFQIKGFTPEALNTAVSPLQMLSVPVKVKSGAANMLNEVSFVQLELSSFTLKV